MFHDAIYDKYPCSICFKARAVGHGTCSTSYGIHVSYGIIHVPEDIWARRTKPPVQCLGPLVVASVPTHGSRAVWMAVEFAMVALHSQFSVHRILKRKRRRRHLRTCLASDNFIWWSWVLCGVSSLFLSMNVYYVLVYIQSLLAFRVPLGSL